MMRCSSIFAVCRYLQSCLLLYASRTLLQYFAVVERHTEREVYSINTLYDETIGLNKDLYHLGNLNRRPRASRLRHLYTGFRGDINLRIITYIYKLAFVLDSRSSSQNDASTRLEATQH